MSLTLYPLGDYIQLLQRKNLQLEFSGAPLTREVSLVSCDSRQVVPGTLFICKGAHFKVEFLQSAKEQGAFAYLSEKRYDQVDLPCILVSDVRLAMALLADFYYNHPSAKLGVVGITGTKGKSSTAYYLKYIFDEYLAAKGQPASGVISSIETYDGVEKFESHLTTPEPLDLERHFANGVATGMRYLTMEVSSQALKYDRVKNVEFAAAVFLNIGMDHISPIEHPDFEDYKNAKHRLFVDYQAREMIYNADDDTSEFMRIGFGGHQTSYGIERAADYHGTALAQFRSETALGIDFLCEHGGSSTAVRVLSPGEFSASDALCAIALCGAFGVSPAQAAQTLAHTPVQGRFEVVEGLPGRTFIVDYSHNGLALTSALKTLRAYNPHKLLCVFGSVGGRTQVRRRELAEAAGAFADYSIITSDNPDFEPPEDVIKEIASHMPEGAPYTCIIDRRDAIRAAIGMAEDGDIILFAGKGHEDYQLINGKKLHFVEREIIKEACAEISK